MYYIAGEDSHFMYNKYFKQNFAKKIREYFRQTSTRSNRHDVPSCLRGRNAVQTDATRPSVTPSHRPRPAGQRRSALTCSLTPAGALRKNRVPMPMKKCSPFPPQSTPIHRSVQTYRSSKIVLPRAKRTQPLYYDSAGYM